MLVNSNLVVVNPPFYFNGLSFPANIEAIFSDNELAALGLKRVINNGPPVNEIIDSATITAMPDGSVQMVYVAHAAPPVVPQIISDRQFFQQLAVQNVITQDEALAAVKTGALPPALQTLVSALPQAQQFSANMLLSGATEFDRSNPLVSSIGAAYGWTSTQLDTFWTAAYAL